MTQDKNTTHEADLDLDVLFAEAAQTAPVPSAGLLARIEADAQQVQANMAQVAPARDVVQPAAWRRWLSEIGGFPALGGLAMSACLGLYLGFVNPDLTASVQALAGFDATATQLDDPFSMPMLSDLDWIDEG